MRTTQRSAYRTWCGQGKGVILHGVKQAPRFVQVRDTLLEAMHLFLLALLLLLVRHLLLVAWHLFLLAFLLLLVRHLLLLVRHLFLLEFCRFAQLLGGEGGLGASDARPVALSFNDGS